MFIGYMCAEVDVPSSIIVSGIAWTATSPTPKSNRQLDERAADTRAVVCDTQTRRLVDAVSTVRSTSAAEFHAPYALLDLA